MFWPRCGFPSSLDVRRACSSCSIDADESTHTKADQTDHPRELSIACVAAGFLT